MMRVLGHCAAAVPIGVNARIHFEALFGLDRFAIALGSFAELGRIACPGFDVENAQGQTVRAEGKCTVHDQSLGAIDAIADRADALHSACMV
jgi:hypothetical protein